MHSRFEILFDFSFRHGYFDAAVPDCFRVEPDGETAGYLRNQNILFKPKADGFTVFFESENNDLKRTRQDVLSEKRALRFLVALRDPLFYNYTTPTPENVANSVFYFNGIHSQERDKEQRLHAEDHVSAADLKSLAEVKGDFFVRPFAVIDLELSTALSAGLTIRFQEKSTYWRYLLVSDHLKDLHEPAVVNGSVLFDGPQKVLLPDNTEALAFVSQQPISLQRRSNKKIQLLENFDKATQKGKVVLRALPAPDVNIISLVPKERTGAEFSEIII
jgi:hypothetical protein